MKKSLVWDIIEQFTTQEERDFRRFLQSPYFNTRQDLVDLYEYLLSIKKEQVVPSRQEVFKAVFPQKELTQTEMRLFLSYLFRLLEQFLEIEKNKNNRAVRKRTLLDIYKERKLSRHFNKTLKEAHKQSENAGLQHPEYHLENYYLELHEYRERIKSGRTQALNLQKLEDSLDAAFISFKLRQACLARSHEAVFNTKYDTRLIDLLLKSIEKEKVGDFPVVAVYYNCYIALYKEPTDERFRDFRTKLIEVTPLFPQEEIRTLYLLALNYCIKKININERVYLQEALDLYKRGLENNLLLENGHISRFAFNNIVGIALRLGDYAWTESFVVNYEKSLAEAYRAETFHLNSARLDYARGRYDAALLHLQKADYRDVISNMTAKILQMKIYFETGEIELLHSHLASMEMYIRRNKKISYHYTNWKNIVQYTRRLAKINPYDKADIEKLGLAIRNEEILTEKKWLLNQIK